jgi:ActR/RegA family two-component response regulator
VIAATPDADEEPADGVTPWVLLVISDRAKRRAGRKSCEDAGFGVEVAKSALDAVECLQVMTPTHRRVGLPARSALEARLHQVRVTF